MPFLHRIVQIGGTRLVPERIVGFTNVIFGNSIYQREKVEYSIVDYLDESGKHIRYEFPREEFEKALENDPYVKIK